MNKLTFNNNEMDQVIGTRLNLDKTLLCNAIYYFNKKQLNVLLYLLNIIKYLMKKTIQYFEKI